MLRISLYKTLMTAFMALSLLSCLACFGQRNPAQQFYRDTLLPVLKAQHVRNFTVKGYDTWITDTGTTSPQLTCYRHYHVSDKNLAFETDSSMVGFNRNMYYDKKSLRLTDLFEGYVVDGTKSSSENELTFDGFQFVLSQMLNYNEVYYSFLLRSFINAPYAWSPKEKIDTVIDGRTYIVLRGKKVMGFTRDTSTDEQIPVVNHYEWFCDREKLEVTLVNVLIEPLNMKKTFEISDYSYENKDLYVDSLFFRNPALERFTRYDCNVALPTSLIIDMTDSTRFSIDSIFNLPIIALSGDTTTLNRQKGWVLLDLWTIRCKPCRDLPIALQKEQREFGYRKMEQAGIKIMYVNATANATDKMREHVAQWDCEDITYACSGLLSRLKENSVPQYYLISPDKRIVWHSSEFTSSEDIISIIEKNIIHGKN